VYSTQGGHLSEQRHFEILTYLARHTGELVPARFLRHTKDFIPEVDLFHPLVSGIYKPAWSKYALSIVTKPSSPYGKKDEILFLDDGRWIMTYSPRSGGLDISDNRALVECMNMKMPLAVFQQVSDKKSHQGSTYLVLGLGLITNFDIKNDVFVIESIDREALERTTSVIPDEEERYEVQIYAQITNEFRPFVREETTTYSVSAYKRDIAFRKVVLTEYEFHCSICGMKFHLGELAEAQAAHIVPKNQNGTDDPRNGLSLCRTHHWAFDNGLFTVTENYQINVSNIVSSADTANFNLNDFNSNQIALPKNEILAPHQVALDWHRKNIFQI
jgi:hypothetical protein